MLDDDEPDSDLLGLATAVVVGLEELEPESADELDEPAEPFELEESLGLEESPEPDSPELDVVPLAVELEPLPPRLSVL